MSTPTTRAPRLAQLAQEFEEVGPSERLQLLLELSAELPGLPPHLTRDSMQRVPECQSPLYRAVEVTDDQRVHLYFDAPPEVPTTRGLASKPRSAPAPGSWSVRIYSSEHLQHGRRFGELTVRNLFLPQ
jgi:hypothetical protein